MAGLIPGASGSVSSRHARGGGDQAAVPAKQALSSAPPRLRPDSGRFRGRSMGAAPWRLFSVPDALLMGWKGRFR